MVPPLPEALYPRRLPLANAITITFKAYKNGEWYITDEV